MVRMHILTAILVFSSLGVPAIAQDSNEYARLARASWSAFECSSLASKIAKADEQKRLFLFGYEQGKKFISAIQSGKIEQADLAKEAPIIILLLLQGPSPDFMLGRIFEAAQESALETVLKTGEHLNSDDAQKAIATNKFRELNCQLIGSER